MLVFVLSDRYLVPMAEVKKNNISKDHSLIYDAMTSHGHLLFSMKDLISIMPSHSVSTDRSIAFF